MLKTSVGRVRAVLGKDGDSGASVASPISGVPRRWVGGCATLGAAYVMCGRGRMWQGPGLQGDERMAEIRIKEAHETGAQFVITACPLCLIMLEDGLKTVGLEKEMKVMDLNEQVLRSLK